MALWLLVSVGFNGLNVEIARIVAAAPLSLQRKEARSEGFYSDAGGDKAISRELVQDTRHIAGNALVQRPQRMAKGRHRANYGDR